MALDELDAAVYRAQQQHDAAKQRAMDLHSDSVHARHEAAQAATVGEVLLADAAAGQADVTDEQLMDASDQARKAEARATIAEAKAAAGQRQRELAEIELLRAQGAVLAAAFERSIQRELVIAEAIDSAKADLDNLVEALMQQQRATTLAFHAAAHHNQMLDVGHCRNAILASLPQGEKPRAQIPPRHVGTNVVRCELLSIVGSGFNAGQKNLIHSLSGRMHQAHGRRRDDTLKAMEAAEAAA